MFSRRYIGLFIFTLMLIMPMTAAAGHKNVDTSSAQEIVDGMATKGVRGAANIVTGWAEIPKQIMVTGEQDGWAKGAFVGPFKGIGMAIVRTACGIGELATFFVAYPGFYDPWLEPRFVWMKE